MPDTQHPAVYVGNIPYDLTEAQLKEAFDALSPTTPAVECRIIVDPATRVSRGFGFVTLRLHSDIPVAVAAVHGKDIGGRLAVVREARERKTEKVAST